jgi:hypothetical protein
METPLLTAAVIFLILVSTDDPNVFRYRPLRFLYRFGFPLYFRVFKVLPRSDKFSIPRWKIEHWMVAAGFSEPMAEEDGDGRFVLMDFTGLFRFNRIPLLMRGKISWNNKDRNVVVCSYATWSYLLFFAIFGAMLLVPTQGNGYICLGTPMLAFLLWCSIIYIKQAKRFRSLGEKVAEYLSEDHQE